MKDKKKLTLSLLLYVLSFNNFKYTQSNSKKDICHGGENIRYMQKIMKKQQVISFQQNNFTYFQS